jgi:hypothetical protein
MADAIFKLRNIRRLYKASREITGGRNPAQQVAVGVEAADVDCLTCGASWSTRKGNQPGGFMPALGGIVLKCPTCGTQGIASTTQDA